MAKQRLFDSISNYVGKDTAVSEITVVLDTSKWSSRKKNLVINGLKTGVATCGVDTSLLVNSLAQAAGGQVLTAHKWVRSILSEKIKPEKLEDLIAYTAAWLRIKAPEEYMHQNYVTRLFLSNVAAGTTPQHIPLPDTLSPKEKQDFIIEYLRESTDVQTQALHKIASMVENNQKISLTYT